MVTVLPNVTPGNKLYALGMPKMSSDSRSLAYGDGKTSLPWIADTAWEAPLRYTPPSQSAPPSADLWRAYVWDRATKGFTAVLVALAPQYVAQLPANNVVPGFRPLAGCSPANGTVIPNECNQSVLPNLGCKTTWSFTWSDPTGTATLPAVCTAASGKITLNKPLACPSTSPCDRVLILTNNEFPQPSPVSGNSLAVWTETTDSSTSSVQAQFVDDAGDPVGDPIVISEDDYTFAKLPTITLDPSGNYLVAWQTEYPDGTLDVISTQWLDPDGNPIGDPQQTASPTDGQQAEPELTTDRFGDVLLAWTGYSLDGSDSELLVQDMTALGAPTTDAPSVITDPSQVDVSSPQIQASAQGGSVLAWNATDRATRTPGVYFQRLNPHGKPVGPQRAVGHGSGLYRRLVWLAVAPNGRFSIRWESRSPSGAFLGYFEQQFDADGNEGGGETPVPSN